MTSSLVRAVVGILKRGDMLLVGERPLGKPYSGYWEFPGGKIESQETSLEALKRELKEELGVEMMTAHFLFQHSHTYPDKIVLLEIWLVETFKGEPESREQQNLRWVTLNEIKALHLLEGNWAILDKLKTCWTSGVIE